jgi:hypothetical protein
MHGLSEVWEILRKAVEEVGIIALMRVFNFGGKNGSVKKSLLFLCVLAFAFAYTDPPISEVMAHNLAPGFLEGLKGQVPGSVDPEGGHPAYFNATLIGVFPSVEDRVPADAGTYRILWTWGENYSDYVHIAGPIEGTTIDGEGCTCNDVYLTLEPQNTEYSFLVKVDNATIYWMDGAPADIAYFNLTRSPEQMEGYNATEKMEVRLEYSARYFYSGVCTGGCNPGIIVEEGGHTELSYYVENGNVTFFTARPVLGEQWYRNNHFDNLVFSKKRFYKSELYLDGVPVGSAHTLNFSIYTGAGGAWFINSSMDNNYTNTTLGEFEMVYTPIPLIPNNESFRYLYEENFSYSGIGRHNLTLVLTDEFGGSHEYSRELLSRAAGEQEAAEEGAYYAEGGAEYARPTYEKPEESLTQVIIPTGALAIIFIVVAASTWWGMTGAKRH